MRSKPNKSSIQFEFGKGRSTLGATRKVLVVANLL